MPTRLEDLDRVYTSPLYWSIRFACVTPFVLLAVALVMLFSSYPSFSIQTLYIPALDKSINQTPRSDGADSLIFFDLQIQNVMEHKGVLYGPIKLTFSYVDANTSVLVGTYTMKGFYQGMGKTAHRRGAAVATGGVWWREAAMGAVSNGSTADFRVDLDAKVKFNNYIWYTWAKRITSRGIVKVGESGREVGKRGVELNNSSQEFTMVVGNFFGFCILVFFVLFFVFFLKFVEAC